MASLAETNPYLRDKKKRREMAAKNTFGSAVFEGASPYTVRKMDRSDLADVVRQAVAKKQADK